MDGNLGSEEIANNTNFVTDLTSPDSFNNDVSGGTLYREFQYIRGISIVVDTMNKFDSTFDLIEMSPRLVVDISDKVIDFKITKTLSDIGITSLPVGHFLHQMELYLYLMMTKHLMITTHQALLQTMLEKIKFNFYEIILDVDGFDYYVPIKTLYSEGFPQADVTAGTISINLEISFFS
jgi:hypothetical protein